MFTQPEHAAALPRHSAAAAAAARGAPSGHAWSTFADVELEACFEPRLRTFYLLTIDVQGLAA